MKKILILVLLVATLFGCSSESKKVDTSMLSVIGTAPEKALKYEEKTDQMVAKIALLQKKTAVTKMYVSEKIFYMTDFGNEVAYQILFEADKSDKFSSLTSSVEIIDSSLMDALPKLISGLEETLPILKVKEKDIKEIITLIDADNVDFNVKAVDKSINDVNTSTYPVFNKTIDNFTIEFEIIIQDFKRTDNIKTSFSVKISQK